MSTSVTSDSGPLVEAENISRSYGGETILNGVSLTIRPGSLTTLVGPSGSGKTTLLALLALLLQPTSGTIRVRGRDASRFSDKELSGLRNEFYGTIVQASHLVGSLSVLDNVLVPALLSNRARAKRPRAEELLHQLGLGDRLHHLPHMLSLGQKRRVSIARALLMEPAVVLADEPTNDLDERRAGEVADFLLSLPGRGYALILATHDRDLAARAGNRWRIGEGRLQAD